MSGDQETSPQHLAGSGHMEGIRHTMKAYLDHQPPSQQRRETSVEAMIRSDVTTTARLKGTTIQSYRHSVQLTSTSPPFSKVALLLVAQLDTLEHLVQ